MGRTYPSDEELAKKKREQSGESNMVDEMKSVWDRVVYGNGKTVGNTYANTPDEIKKKLEEAKKRRGK